MEINERLYHGDLCCLKSDPSLIGRVARTSYDMVEPENLAYFTIYRYTQVPEEDTTAFMNSGTPPRGYVFIVFIQHSYGSALVHENDLELIDRTFELGDPVKRDLKDAMQGTVIGATTKCTLEPIVYQPVDHITGDHLQPRFTEKPIGSLKDFPVSESPETSPSLLYDVPQSELHHDEDFAEGDYIIYNQQLGIIIGVDHGLTLLLPDSTVVTPLDPIPLGVPLHDDAGDTLSSGDPNICIPVDENCVWSSESTYFPGQSVLTKRSNISRTDHQFGNDRLVVQAYVLATPVEEISVRWLCPDVFSPSPQEYNPGIEMFRASTLKADAIKCDFSRSRNQDPMVGNCTSRLKVGDRVRFHDESVAGKYPKYRRIPSYQTFGYDMNIFKIVSTKTEVVIQWQDGSCTTESATSLQTLCDWVGELCPGNLVALKDGIKTVEKPANASSGPVPSLFHRRGTMHLRQVGVVQTVESRERTASIRWYQNSVVDLTHGGKVLNPGSTMGQLGDTITTVSLYELATFPALKKCKGDLVVVAPTSVDQSVMVSTPMGDTTKSNSPFRTQSFTSPYDFWTIHFQTLKSAMIASDWFKNTTTIRKPPLRRRYSVRKDEATSPVDFFGKIIAMDTGGIITIRFPSSSGCWDIQVPFERIMAVIFDFPISFGINYPYEDEHLDADIIDNSWIPEDESDNSLESDGYIHIRDGRVELGDLEESRLILGLLETSLDNSPPSSCEDTTAGIPTISPSQGPGLPSIIHLPDPESCPPGFAVLEDMPPSDHRFINNNNSRLLADRARCIRKEFEILKSSLPPGIFVRSWETHMDLLRVMIIGPEGTPYEHVPLVFDIHLPSNYPYEPPTMSFHSWTSGQGPINPNLYENGDICLSILGTWPSRSPNETWLPGISTILQVLVSMMGLVLVNNPFYNEAGFEVLAAEDNRRIESSQYTEKVFLMTRRFILHALEHRVRGFEDVLDWHYHPSSSSTRPRLLRKAIEDALAMIEHHNDTTEKIGQGPEASAFCARLSLGAVIVLRRHVEALEKMEQDLTV